MSFPPAERLRLVIFDCDGVLVDSEGPSSRAVAAALSELGWEMDAAEAMRRFIGFTLEQMAPVVAAHIGRALPEGWIETVRQRVIRVMTEEAELVPGAREALAGCAALGLPVRVASNSSRREMQAKFARVGLLELLDRAHSADDVAAGKPAPDVFLLAARTAGVAPSACVVVEDSVPGATGAIAAGMACLGYVPEGDGAALVKVGATPFRSMAELPGLFGAAMRRAA